uniref:Uncharacterized protein n=1 Tax=Anopheles melas TaxID=34690 RepID=A0A182U9K5_9DIPT
MAFKFVVFAALVAVARAGLIASPAVSYAAAPAYVSAAPVAKVAYAAAPIAKVAYAAQPEEYDANPQYSFSYGISDALTGDSKSQQESRSGDVVQGSYSVVDPDGTKRTVEPVHVVPKVHPQIDGRKVDGRFISGTVPRLRWEFLMAEEES